MTLHTNLPIYKKGCDLVQLAFNVQQQMPRSFKRTLGEKITGHCTDMLDLMAMANASQGAQRTVHIQSLLQRQRATTVLLRVCHDMRFISHKVWADSVLLLDSIGKQGGGWLKSVTRNIAPAA
jgi:hypothetical protein